MSTLIKSVRAREILSAGDFPTLETSIILENGLSGKASVPFGTSSGKHEALTLIDNDPKRYDGFGMLKAVKNVNEVIAPKVIGIDVLNQKDIDSKLISLDKTERKEILGGNSILSVSLACARTASLSNSIPLYRHIVDVYEINDQISQLPKPMMVLMEGGKHADNATDFQEYMIAVLANTKTADRVRMGTEIYHKLGEILNEKGHETNVGLEGAYAATGMNSNKTPLLYINKAIVSLGYDRKNQISIALDPAASEFFENNLYNLESENKKITSDELIQYYRNLVDRFGIISIEDGFAEDDWESWQKYNMKFGDKIMIVGDDLTVTQKALLQKAIEKSAVNSVIIKPNQVGTLTETMETVNLAKKNNLKTIVSHRSGGETTDTFIVDLAVAISSEFIKVGPSRGERTEKYNRLMEIGDELGL